MEQEFGDRNANDGMTDAERALLDEWDDAEDGDDCTNVHSSQEGSSANTDSHQTDDFIYDPLKVRSKHPHERKR